jgi:hypothetical protein
MSPIVSTLAGVSARGYGFSSVVLDTAYNYISSVTVPAGNTSAVVFSSIPQTYKHLVVRMICKVTGSSRSTIYYQMNGNTTQDYVYYQAYSVGSGLSASGSAGGPGTDTAYVPSAADPDAFGAAIVLIPDYAGSTIKSIQTIAGMAVNGTNFVLLRGGAYYGTGSTSSITSLRFYPTSGSIAEYSTFALYGIKG